MDHFGKALEWQEYAKSLEVEITALRAAVRDLSEALQYIKDEVGLNDYVDQVFFDKGYDMMDSALERHAKTIGECKEPSA